MAQYPEVILRFHSSINGECLDEQAKVIHGYIVSEKHNAVFPLPSEPTKRRPLPEQDEAGGAIQTKAEYVFTEGPGRLDQDADFINNFLVKVYQDAKRGNLR